MADCTDAKCMYAVLTPFCVIIAMLLASVVVIAWPVNKEAMKEDCDRRQKEEEEAAAEEAALRKSKATWDGVIKSGGPSSPGSTLLVVTTGHMSPNGWKDSNEDPNMVVETNKSSNDNEPAFEMQSKNEPKA